MTHESHLALNRSIVVPPDHPGSPYLEISATYAVHNRYLRIALGVAVLVIAMFSIAGWRLAQAWADRKPLVVRITQDGDAAVAPFAALDYRPREPEIQYFLNRFVVEHYGRVRATVNDDFQRKLFFLSSEMTRAAMEQEQRTQEIKNFVISASEEAHVFVTNIMIEDLRKQPYKARVNFDKIFRPVGSSREARRERYTAQIQFNVLGYPPEPSFIKVNPLGYVVTYLRHDQAFDSPPMPVESARGTF